MTEPAALTGWLGRVLPGQRITSARRLSGGYSNENLAIETSAGHRFVLRRYVRANRCAVEAALAARLDGVVPVPRVIAADPDGTAAGEPVLLTEFAGGVLLSQILAGRADPAGQRRRASADPDAVQLGRAVGVALAAIGTVRFPGGGLLTGPDLVPRADADGMPDSLPGFVEQCLAAAGPDTAGAVLSAAERDGLRGLARQSAPRLAVVAGASQLVHSDYNPKNLLVARATRKPGADSAAAGWTVTAVLDWEFAFSGSPLTDVGNLLRFGGELPDGFAAGFTGGYLAAGGQLPDGWREISAALDLYALADFLTRPAGHEIAGKAVALIRERVRSGRQEPGRRHPA